MQKCPLAPFFSKPSTSFLYKLLIALKQLQQQNKQKAGASFEEIVRFMRKTCDAELDIGSQVYYTLRKAEQSRLVTKINNTLYVLNHPAACLHMVPESCVKAKLKELQNIFSATPTVSIGRFKRKLPTCEELVCGDSKKCKKPKSVTCGESVSKNKSCKQRKRRKKKMDRCCDVSIRRSPRLSARSKRGRRSKSRSRSRSRSVSPCGIRRDFIKEIGVDPDSSACETSDDDCEE
nr:unnamed protein product [Callosobruchus analis]